MIKHTLHFHGSLRKYGKSFDIACSTIRGGVHLLAEQIDGLKNTIISGHYSIFKGKEDEKLLISIPECSTGKCGFLDYPLGDEPQDIHIYPKLLGAGGGDSNIFGIIAGAIIMIVGIVMSPWTGGTSFGASMAASSSLMGITYGTIVMFGAAIMLSSLAMMLAPMPNVSLDRNSASENASYFLSSPRNNSSQGNAIPIAFGRTWCGSYALSVGMEVYAI